MGVGKDGDDGKVEHFKKYRVCKGQETEKSVLPFESYKSFCV